MQACMLWRLLKIVVVGFQTKQDPLRGFKMQAMLPKENQDTQLNVYSRVLCGESGLRSQLNGRAILAWHGFENLTSICSLEFQR